MHKVLTLLCLLAFPIKAFSHPHIWVNADLELLTKKHQITGIRVKWSFDELYSTSFLVESDTNKNKQLEPNEVANTIKEVFITGEKDLYPFIYISMAGKKTTFTLKNPNVWMTNDYLHYQFDIILDDPKEINGQHHFGIYDPEFYVAFEQNIKMKIPDEVSCSQILQKDRNISLYMGTFNPEIYTLTCH